MFIFLTYFCPSCPWCNILWSWIRQLEMAPKAVSTWEWYRWFCWRDHGNMQEVASVWVHNIYFAFRRVCTLSVQSKKGRGALNLSFCGRGRTHLPFTDDKSKSYLPWRERKSENCSLLSIFLLFLTIRWWGAFGSNSYQIHNNFLTSDISLLAVIKPNRPQQ